MATASLPAGDAAHSVQVVAFAPAIAQQCERDQSHE
jgi:hypothetical protein